MYIKGVGMTNFGAQPDLSHELVYEATMEALDDAQLGLEEINAIVISTMDTESNGERQRLFSGILSSILKKNNRVSS